MFGVKALFAALGRLTLAVGHSAELFEAANRQLEQQLGLDAETPALPEPREQIEDRPHRRNGRKHVEV